MNIVVSIYYLGSVLAFLYGIAKDFPEKVLLFVVCLWPIALAHAVIRGGVEYFKE